MSKGISHHNEHQRRIKKGGSSTHTSSRSQSRSMTSLKYSIRNNKSYHRSTNSLGVRESQDTPLRRVVQTGTDAVEQEYLHHLSKLF